MNFKEHKDNDKFTGKIKGLADLDDKATGDALATNKNYVDSKLAQASADSPIETIYRDKDGNELEKHGDNYYPKILYLKGQNMMKKKVNLLIKMEKNCLKVSNQER